QQRQAQTVDPNVVVFPEGAGRLQVAMRALLAGGRAPADAAVAVDQVRLAPQLAFPFGGLLQQVVPGDTVVMWRVEPAIVDRAAHRLMQVADQTAVEGEPGEDRQIALGDAERQVDLSGFAPFRDDLALAQYEAVRAAARPHRPKRLVERRLFAEIARDDLSEIASPRRLVLAGIPSRGGDPLRIETGGFRQAT